MPSFRIGSVALLLVIAACANQGGAPRAESPAGTELPVPPTPVAVPAQSPPPADAPAGQPAAAPPEPPAAPSQPPPSAAAPAPASLPSGTTAARAGSAAKPSAAAPQVPVRSAPAAAAIAPVPATAAPAAPVASAPALDLNGLEQRLRDTSAIGLFTKLSLKNQVDDLLAQFKAFYRGGSQVTLDQLRQRYEVLLLKVISLLQDNDPSLASAVSSSREAIWGVLTDPKKFANI